MNVKFVGKNIEITEAMKNVVQEKLEHHISRLIPENAEFVVKCSVTKSDQTIEITVPINNRVLRAEASHTNFYASIDEVILILEKQLVKYKRRINDRKHIEKNKENFEAVNVTDEEPKFKIEKTKQFQLKPIDVEEAILEMELLGHNFYVFNNALTEEVNVVYKRRNGNYGLIESKE